MRYDFHGKSPVGAVQKLIQQHPRYARRTVPTLAKKAAFQLAAPPITWGFWTEIWAQFGVTGPDAENHETTVEITFESFTRLESTFDVEFAWGGQTRRTVGPGAASITIVGNVATAISMRAKSHLGLQNILVHVL